MSITSNLNTTQQNRRKTILLLGGTGSVGTQVCNLVAQYPELFHIKTIVCKGDNPTLIASMVKKLGISKVATNNHDTNELRILLTKQGSICQVSGGNDGIINACQEKHDMCISAISGISALLPLLAAIPYCHRVGLANKETIICFGDHIKKLAEEHNTKIIPLDSEHNALFEILQPEQENNQQNNNLCSVQNIRKVIITASGGPMWNVPTKEMDSIPVENVLKHPVWGMGQKISIDSATMINKGFEVIEAERLFGISTDMIEPIVHRQSFIHGAVEYNNGSTVMYMAPTTMEIPISNFLFEKKEERHQFANIDLIAISKLEFAKPDHDKFPLLNFAIECHKQGRQALVALNAANESTVKAFIEKRINFSNIVKINMKAVEEATKITHSLETPEELIRYHEMVSILVHDHISSSWR